MPNDLDAKRQVGDAASLNYNWYSTYTAIAHMRITKPFSCRVLIQMSTRPFDRFWLVAVVLVACCGQAALGNTQTQKTSAQGPQSKPLVLMTYNVLADRIASTERMKSLFEIMEKTNPISLPCKKWLHGSLLSYSNNHGSKAAITAHPLAADKWHRAVYTSFQSIQSQKLVGRFLAASNKERRC